MKRHEKIALLTKVVQGNITEQTKQQLRQSVETGPIIAIICAGCEGLKPDDEVWTQEGTEKITMAYRNLDDYAARKGNPVIFLLPHNGRD